MMEIVLGVYFALPLWSRVLVFLALLFLIWWRLGKPILWILSIVPYIFGKLFSVIYYIIEVPIDMLHKKFGAIFYKVDNGLAYIGSKIISFFEKWYRYWHEQYKFHLGSTILVFFICYSIIVMPSWIRFENELLSKGKELYLSGENACIEYFEIKTENTKQKNIQNVAEEQIERDVQRKEKKSINLVVSGVNSSLLVRDVPEMDGIALERLHNGDVVIWYGELIFEEAEGEHIEAWVKVKTTDSIEGWSRLLYLHPVDYKDKMFYVSEDKG